MKIEPIDANNVPYGRTMTHDQPGPLYGESEYWLCDKDFVDGNKATI